MREGGGGRGDGGSGREKGEGKPAWKQVGVWIMHEW